MLQTYHVELQYCEDEDSEMCHFTECIRATNVALAIEKILTNYNSANILSIEVNKYDRGY